MPIAIDQLDVDLQQRGSGGADGPASDAQGTPSDDTRQRLEALLRRSEDLERRTAAWGRDD